MSLVRSRIGAGSQVSQPGELVAYPRGHVSGLPSGGRWPL